MPQDNLKARLQAFIDEVWNAGNFDNLADYVSAAYTVKHDPGDPWEHLPLDHSAFITRVLYSRKAFPDLYFDVREMVAEGQRVVAFWVMSGTHQGDLPNLPATGKAFAISGITIYDFDDDGKVCGHTQAYDRLGFMAQMGLLQG